MKKTVFIAIISALCVLKLQAQRENFFRGLIFDDSTYAQIPQKAELLTRSYEVLPASHSLKAYCPAIRSQGIYGTCVGWAVAYAARTITEALANNWKESAQITGEAFSPTYLYSMIKDDDDRNCQEGANLQLAFEALKRMGAVKLSDFSANCPSSIPADIRSKAIPYSIDNYFILFYPADSHAKKVNTTKKALSENRPVAIGMTVYDSFDNINEEVWNGTADRGAGGHAMCVVAYDDNRYGGAFLLMNSWGSSWGNGGFKWVRYADYSRHTRYGIEMYVRNKPVPVTPDEPQPPKPRPTPPVTPRPTPPLPPRPEFVDLSGELHFVLSTGQEMRPHLHSLNNMPYYKMEGSYISDTRYRLFISNNEPAYVYVIGSDLTGAVSKVFPPNNRISAALVYRSNDIPDERWFIQMDNTKGKDYICVLYSSDELPIDDIVNKIKAASGSFFDKVNKVLEDKTVPPKTINYSTSVIRFDVKKTDKIVVPVIVEIEHL